MAPATTPRRSDTIGGWVAFGLSVAATVIYYPLAVFGPGWWRGARLSDMDAPFDLVWLHNTLAWLAEYVGRALLGAFLAAVVLLPAVGIAIRGFRAVPPVVERVVTKVAVVAVVGLMAVPVLAVAWFLCTQIAYLIAPYLGMYHGELRPAVP